MTHLLLTVRLLDDRYHGLLADGGPPEWPPSPFRLFCALVAGLARRDELEGDAGRALAWLQTLDPPDIIAPQAKKGLAITRYVPNNDGDKWPDRQDRLGTKPTIPTLFLLPPNQNPEVHYLWNVRGTSDVPLEHIRTAARSLIALGWGIDMAFADARLVNEEEIQRLSGSRWRPTRTEDHGAGIMLRVPTSSANMHEGTLADLKHCHETVLQRIGHRKSLHTVDQPRVFEKVLYFSFECPLARPYRLFELRDADGSRYRYPHRKLIHIAGMVRHLAIEAMRNRSSWPHGVVDDDWCETYVAGHRKGAKLGSVKANKCRADEDNDPHGAAFADSDEHRQLSYLPLPSVGHRHTDPGVRRVMIAAPVGDEGLLNHVARRLAGQVLMPLGDEFPGEPPMLVPLRHDSVANFYTKPGNVWHSFTPVILPGHDDHRPEKTRALIVRALSQSGIEQPCEFEWSAFSRFPKAYSAHKYGKDGRPQGYIRPGYLLSQTAVHLTLRFKCGLEVPGPLAIGAGRHCGFGLMAKIDG